MPDSRITEQVVGILNMKQVAYESTPENDSFRVRSGSTAVSVDFVDWGGQTLITLRVPVLQNVDGGGKRRQKILEEINRLNSKYYFGTLAFYEDSKTILLDHSLLGDHLQAEELMNALEALATTADDIDDQLKEAIGTGERWADVEARTAESEAAGPAVST